MNIIVSLARLFTLLVIAYISFSDPLAVFANPDIGQAVVKIYVTSNSPDYDSPWNMLSPMAVTGSGSIIEGGQILTNAHVVDNQTFIQVRRQGDPRRYQARLLIVDEDVDLALLTVDDQRLFSGVHPLQLGQLPQLQQEVRVYGYPLGGDTLSITKGIISRIEHQMYANSYENFLAVQIDAAINPGNSGGPAIVNDRIVGIATQSRNNAQNIGYIVPAPIISHFLTDIRAGHYHGFPSLGVRFQSLENPAQREKYGLSQDQTGALVVKILPGSPAENKLKIDDVVLTIDGHTIANDISVEFRPREWTSLDYYIQAHQIGDVVNLEVLRQGEMKSQQLILDKTTNVFDLVPLEFNVLPRYYIIGGLVFTPLTINYFKAWGENWTKDAPDKLLVLWYPDISTEGQEVVLLHKVLAYDTNAGYQDLRDVVITKVNGKRIINFRDFVQHVKAIPNDDYLVFEDDRGNKIVLNKKKVFEDNKKILSMYHIDRESYLGLKEENASQP
jgi:S1-C subfamily serine protease